MAVAEANVINPSPPKKKSSRAKFDAIDETRAVGEL